MNSAPSVTGAGGYNSSQPQTGSCSKGKFGLWKVTKSFTDTVKNICNWVAKAPSKPLTAFRIVVLVAIAAGVVCLGLAVSKALPLVIVGGGLSGVGYLYYRNTQTHRT